MNGKLRSSNIISRLAQEGRSATSVFGNVMFVRYALRRIGTKPHLEAGCPPKPWRARRKEQDGKEKTEEALQEL
jgi:hypothetical protein